MGLITFRRAVRYQQRCNGLHSYGFQYYIGLCTVLALTALWPYESSGYLATCASGTTAYTMGFYCIRYAHKRGYVSSVAGWNYVFLAKIVISWLILVYFWVGPMQPDLFRVSSGDHFDGMFYDYHAAAIADQGWKDASVHLNFTWLSFGVVFYAAIIYTVFGVNLLNIAFFNATLALLMAIAISAGIYLILGSSRRLDRIKWTMILPFACFYDAIVTKDTPCNTLFAVCFAASVRVFSVRKRSPKSLVILALSLIGLTVFRINLAALALVCVGILAIAQRRIPLHYVVGALAAGCLGVGLFAQLNPSGVEILKKIVTPSEYFQGQQSFVERASEGASPLRVVVAQAMIPRDIVGLLVLSPLRAAIWIFSPYPEILPVNIEIGSSLLERETDPEALGNWLVLVLGCASAWIICFEFPFILKFVLSWRRWLRCIPGYFVLWVFLIVAIMLTANLTFVGARRYRTMVEPLLFTIAACNGGLVRPGSALRVTTYMLLFVPLVVYWLYKLL